MYCFTQQYCSKLIICFIFNKYLGNGDSCLRGVTQAYPPFVQAYYSKKAPHLHRLPVTENIPVFIFLYLVGKIFTTKFHGYRSNGFGDIFSFIYMDKIIFTKKWFLISPNFQFKKIVYSFIKLWRQCLLNRCYKCSELSLSKFAENRK